MRRFIWIILVLICLAGVAIWSQSKPGGDRFQPLSPDTDTASTTVSSAFPIAVDAKKVGTYPSMVKSGGGYFYDEVLEYRVWIDPQSGGERLNEGSDYFKAFATYESAKRFSEITKGAEHPLVLVRQFEHVNEPTKGVFEHVVGERLAEWKVEWLTDSKREPNSIAEFLAKKNRK
jgi:hypothetical protein